ncbi:MAG: hypothetical protein HYT76_00445 [Deltaproteobacteria bacterium]|nr:hypothetical protein [Deltaproteobacteria bacterium]
MGSPLATADPRFTLPAATTLPVISNAVPYHELMFDGRLGLDNFAAVKTRDFDWANGYRGPVLLFTSDRTVHDSVVQAYRLDPQKIPKGALVGVGELVDVRELTFREQAILIDRFNNLGLGRVKLWGLARNLRRQTVPESLRAKIGIGPGKFGLFFRRVYRFPVPIPFVRPPGGGDRFVAPVSLVVEQLIAVGLRVFS